MNEALTFTVVAKPEMSKGNNVNGAPPSTYVHIHVFISMKKSKQQQYSNLNFLTINKFILIGNPLVDSDFAAKKIQVLQYATWLSI